MGTCNCGHSFICKYNPKILLLCDRDVDSNGLKASARVSLNDESLRDLAALNCNDSDIHGGTLLRLMNVEWLNDAIITRFMELLSERDLRHSRLAGCVPSKFFTSFLMGSFYDPWVGTSSYSYAKVKKWLRKEPRSIFCYDKVFFPVNVPCHPKARRPNAPGGLHWLLIVASMVNRTLDCYDSLMDMYEGRFGKLYSAACLKYLVDVFDDVTSKCPPPKDYIRPCAASWRINIKLRRWPASFVI
jgi:hypothetical protein